MPRGAVAGRLHQDVDEFAVRVRGIGTAAEIFIADAADDLVRLGVVEEYVQAVVGSREGVDQEKIVPEDLSMMQPSAHGDDLHRLKRQGVHLHHGRGGEQRGLGLRGERADDVDVPAVRRYHRRVNAGAQFRRQLAVGDDLLGLGVAHHHAVRLGCDGIAADGKPVRDDAGVLVEISPARLRLELRFAGLEFRDHLVLVGAHDVARARFPFPTVENGLEGLDAGDNPVALRLGKLFQGFKVGREDRNRAGCHSGRHTGWTARPHPWPNAFILGACRLQAQANANTGQHS